MSNEISYTVHKIVLHQYHHAATSDQKVIESTSVLSLQIISSALACLVGGFVVSSVFFILFVARQVRVIAA